MIERDRQSGGCLCGAVRFTVAIMPTRTGACHCGMCRKWAGGPYMATDCGTDVTFEGADNIATYRSSPWAERGFCKTCGSNLFYRIVETGQLMMSTGTLEAQDGPVP